MPKVEIIFGKNGSVKSKSKGFAGPECEEATEFLDNLFGVEKRDHTEEYHQTERTTLVDPLPSGHCG
jgi:hypothetical protein